MLWIYLARIIVPGIILGFLIGKLVGEKPAYLKLINPSTWISEAKRATTKRWIRVFTLSIIIGIAMFFVQLKIGNIVIRLFGPLLAEENIFTQIARFSLPVFVISVTVLPILEEWIFRGVILEEIYQFSQSKKTALLSSSLIFAIFHLSNPGTLPPAVITYFIGGLIIGGGYLVGGFSVAVFSHVLYNVIPFLFNL